MDGEHEYKSTLFHPSSSAGAAAGNNTINKFFEEYENNAKLK